MSLERFWIILIKRWKLIVICFIVVGLGTYIDSKRFTPLYQSTVLVQVALSSGNTASDYNSLLASDQLVQTETQLVTSDPVLREVASHYRRLTVEHLSKEVSATARTNTQLFEIDVLDPSPTRAAKLANDVAATLIRQQLQAAQQVNSRSQQQIQQELDTTRQQIDATTAKLATLQANGGNQAQVDVLQAQLSGLQQQYSQWQSTLAQLVSTEAQNVDFLRIVQTAQPGLRPVTPNTLLNMGAGLMIGLSLGLLLAVLIEQLDTRVRTPEALIELLDWPVLATILYARSKENLVSLDTGRTINSESYRILRTGIGFSGIDKPLHSLIVTSALPLDGKTTIAANLAIFMAKVGKTTLLIDADLRNPKLHKLFGISLSKSGLSNAVLAFSMPTTTKTLDSFIHSISIPNLWVIPSGPLPPNPSELLDSKAMQRFLAVIADAEFEIVIFNTPPFPGLSLTSILVSTFDRYLFVADIIRANKQHLKQAKALLAQANANVIGSVVNKQRRRPQDAAYPYYYRKDEQNSKGNHSTENMNSLAALANSFKQPETQNSERNHSTEDEDANSPTVPLKVFKQPEV